MARIGKETIHGMLLGAEFLIGLILALALTAMALLGIYALAASLLAGPRGQPLADMAYLTRLLDAVMLVFIIAELLKMAIAYMREGQVLLAVFEAAFVAVARKVVLLGAEPLSFDKAASLAVISVAVALSWFLIRAAEARSAPERKASVSRMRDSA